MLACFHEDYRSEQPQFPARTFQGIGQVRANWSALLDAMPDFHAEIVRSAVDGDTVFVEIRWTGTKADGTPLEERGVIVMGVRDDRIAWGRLYVDEVEREGAGHRRRRASHGGHRLAVDDGLQGAEGVRVEAGRDVETHEVERVVGVSAWR